MAALIDSKVMQLALPGRYTEGRIAGWPSTLTRYIQTLLTPYYRKGTTITALRSLTGKFYSTAIKEKRSWRGRNTSHDRTSTLTATGLTKEEAYMYDLKNGDKDKGNPHSLRKWAVNGEIPRSRMSLGSN